MPQQKKLAVITVVYWVLLLYIVAALVWWFIALNRQATEMANYSISHLSASDPQYKTLKEEAIRFKQRKNAQYIGEGVIFLLLIMVGAVFVYRATRKEIKLARLQQNFMMAVTHELKTPIAVTRLNIETLLKHQLDEGKRQKLLQMALGETERLNDLANNILLASRMDVGEVVKFSSALDMQKLVADIVRQFLNRFPGRAIHFQPGETLFMQGDELLLGILVSNLVDNAIKYTTADTPIAIVLKRSGPRVTLEVKDNGPGIPDREKGRVFEKFYRLGSEETRIAKGTGLGLYLCKKIVEAHKGNLQILNNIPRGSVFLASFPL